MSTTPRRFAVVTSSTSSLETVQRYLPANYGARSLSGTVYIFGHDNAGWGLDTYVIPRLQSGLHAAREISEEEYRARVNAAFSLIADKIEGEMK
jgi:hypothetical protein